MELQDSGNRREFESGAVRDICEGKGRCDLLPLDIVADIMDDEILCYIDQYIRSGNRDSLVKAIKSFSETRYKTLNTAMLEVSKHYEDGCNKYGERNWQKGIPLHCYIDSGVRHYIKFTRGDDDEPHDRAFLWNMLGALWTQNYHPECCDLPFTEEVQK